MSSEAIPLLTTDKMLEGPWAVSSWSSQLPPDDTVSKVLFGISGKEVVRFTLDYVAMDPTKNVFYIGRVEVNALYGKRPESVKVHDQAMERLNIQTALASATPIPEGWVIPLRDIDIDCKSSTGQHDPCGIETGWQVKSWTTLHPQEEMLARLQEVIAHKFITKFSINYEAKDQKGHISYKKGVEVETMHGKQPVSFDLEEKVEECEKMRAAIASATPYPEGWTLASRIITILYKDKEDEADLHRYVIKE